MVLKGKESVHFIIPVYRTEGELMTANILAPGFRRVYDNILYFTDKPSDNSSVR